MQVVELRPSQALIEAEGRNQMQVAQGLVPVRGCFLCKTRAYLCIGTQGNGAYDCRRDTNPNACPPKTTSAYASLIEYN